MRSVANTPSLFNRAYIVRVLNSAHKSVHEFPFLTFLDFLEIPF